MIMMNKESLKIVKWINQVEYNMIRVISYKVFQKNLNKIIQIN